MKRLTWITAMMIVTASNLADAQKRAAPKPAPTGPYELTAANKRDIMAQVGDKLLDGESARWRWPKHVAEFGLYCGFVNAKNRMGAFTGFTPFMVLGGVGEAPNATKKYLVFSTIIATDEERSSGDSVVHTMCAKRGYDLSKIPPEQS